MYIGLNKLNLFIVSFYKLFNRDSKTRLLNFNNSDGLLVFGFEINDFFNKLSVCIVISAIIYNLLDFYAYMRI